MVSNRKLKLSVKDGEWYFLVSEFEAVLSAKPIVRRELQLNTNHWCIDGIEIHFENTYVSTLSLS